MKGIRFLSGVASGLLLVGTLPATAQVTSDGTTNTTVNQSGNNFDILNGIQKGNNLFHSFKEFSIPTGGSATFLNSSAIDNIINRVTGGNISIIDGLIKANGSANVFLINPAGIVFGENAKLDIGGSFLATTAESLLFEDGFNYSAINSDQTPLLTISVPVGLQMGQNPAAIQINGTGHELSGGTLTPTTATFGSSGLKVKEGNTLALIGGNIQGTGGVLNAESGKVEVGAIGSNTSALVNLSFEESGWKFDYSNINNFASVRFVDKSLIDISGSNPKGININAEDIQLESGTIVQSNNLGNQQAGDININASGDFTMSQLFPDLSEPRILNFAVAEGNGSNINLTAQNMNFSDASYILASTVGKGEGGTVTMTATEDINLIGSPIRSSSGSSSTLVTTISNATGSSENTGKGGNLIVNAQNLNLVTGGGFLSNTEGLSGGEAGDITINVTDNVYLIGETETFAFISRIRSASFGGGEAGNIEINTGRILLKDGGLIEAANQSIGASGNILLNASESITVEGSYFSPRIQSDILSEIRAGTIKPIPFFQNAFGIGPNPSGDSGSVIINSPAVNVADNAQIIAVNEGTGDGGEVTITGDKLNLANQASILTTTESGTGGVINLNLNEIISLRFQSQINAESLITGNGGNININSPVIAGFENSDIIANAVDGNGGNIDITTQGLFGLKFGEQLTEESDITASSEFGINGIVKINNVNIDPSSGLVELPIQLKDSSQQISQGCSSNTDSTFVATGRGGIPQNPSQYLNSNQTWSDIRDSSISRNQNNRTEEITQISNQSAIVEATHFIRNQKGEIELVAVQNTPFNTKQVSNCSGKDK